MTKAGTYSFCKDCPTNGHCCSRVKHNGKIESPVIFQNDIEEIVRYTGKHPDSFSLRRDDSYEGLRSMRTDEAGCYFYNNGECSIYTVRPVDCRLFPLDIKMEEDGRIVWIAYTRLCPVGFDPRNYLEEAKTLLPELGKNVYQYAKMELPGMDKEPYVELEELNLSDCQLEIPIHSRSSNLTISPLEI